VDELVEGYRWDTPLRLVGGLHYLVLGGLASWERVDEALRDHAPFLRRFVAEQGVQTNEVQRSWMLLPCFLAAAERAEADALDLIELGPSAGLNLVWDRYRYVYANGVWGSTGARLELAGKERRPVPRSLLAGRPRVGSRVGVDVSPVDVTTEEGARLLKAFVWPDQTWRLELLDRAIAELRADPPELVRGDAAEVLPGLLRARRADALTVVFETAVLGYLSHEGRRKVLEAIEDAGAAGPLAFVSTDLPADRDSTHYGLHLRSWPGGEQVILANADFHGAWLEWLA
jgi:hypothetical protein